MNVSVGVKKAATAAIGLALLAPMTAPFTPTAQAQSKVLADPAIEQVWSRTDKPVDERMAARSWMWGPQSFYTGYEPYAEGPGGQHLVSYFDKSRMEINNPGSDRNSQWFVTNGLLVVDMMSGKIQAGDNSFIQKSAANLPVAGDTAGSSDTPTYASLARVASLTGNNQTSDRTGQNVNEGIGRTGGVGIVNNLAGYAKYGFYEPTMGHNIADVFWRYIKARGTVYRSGRYEEDVIIDWLFAMGYPITEPYWIKIVVSGQERWVLMQAFQRRILTYSPENPVGWKVEMGNVGRAYYDWRYSQQLEHANPTATVVPVSQANVSLDPKEGSTDTLITVNGANFPPYAAIAIRAEKSSASYSRDITTVAANERGAFTAKIKLPSDAARLGEVQITASANAGAVRAGQPFKLSYQANITVSPLEVVSNGTIRVWGEGFSPKTNVTLGVANDNNGAGRRSEPVRTDASGRFDTVMNIGNRTVGTKLTIVASGADSRKAIADDLVTVIAQPSLRAEPNVGPAGVYVTLRGFSWQPKRSINVGVKAPGASAESWLPNVVTTDSAGNFSVQVWVGAEYRYYSEVRLLAKESVSAIRLETTYAIVTQPTPVVPAIVVSPPALAVGQTATVSGAGWPANAPVALSLGRTAAEEAVGTATTSATGTFSFSFVVSNYWQSGGQIALIASSLNGTSATTPMWIAQSTGHVVPSGLPMEITVFQQKNNTIIRAKGEGWQPGRVINVNIISADGSVNIQVGSAEVSENGKFSIVFDAAAPWWGRTDLGVLALIPDTKQSSLRYLPFAQATKVGSNIYQIRGANWPANNRIPAVAHVMVEGSEEEAQVGVATSDGNGTFDLQVAMPRLTSTIENDLELSAKDQPYNFFFNF